MNMVRHYLKFNDFNLLLIGGLENNFFQPFINPIDQDLPAIFRTPNDVVLTTEHNIVIALELLFRIRVLIIWLTPVKCNNEDTALRATAPKSPRL
jgi:hypothetical protein